MYPEYQSDLKFCKKINRKYGKSFYAGTLFFTPEQRDATFILYAFFRFPDEYVDTYYASQKSIALEKINHWNSCWTNCFNGKDFVIEPEETKILRATSAVFKKYKIPFQYSQDFLNAMIQDTWKERYSTYKELEEYMYGSAGVVGLMMTHIFCFEDKRFAQELVYRENILKKAMVLGEAFQMTNFLRDIHEDYVQRGRIYIPQEDFKRFNVDENDIKNKNISDNFVELMKFQVDRINQLYAEADNGILLLPRRVARGVYIARVLYSKIMDKIIKSGYDVFSSRKSLSFFEKIKEVLIILIKLK
jgi:phytoene synthase